MATDKKHIAVYLDPAVEQALIAFCERKELKSKKGTMFSAGVNAALSEFFGISGIEESNTPQEMGNISSNSSNRLKETGNIPTNPGNIPTTAGSIDSEVEVNVISTSDTSDSSDERFAHALITPEEASKHSAIFGFTPEEALADCHFQVNMLTSNYDELEDRYEAVKTELAKLRSQLETERADREQVEAELTELKQKLATASKNLPEAADLLNQLKARRKKSKADLIDLETILEILEDGGEKTLQQALDKIAGKHDR